LEKLQPLLAADATLATAADRTGKTALHLATTREIAEALLAAGADLNARSRLGESPLYCQVHEHNGAVVGLLLEKGANVEIPATGSGTSPLGLAAAFGHADLVELLLAHQADPEHKNLAGETALIEAAGAGYTKVITVLISHRAAINVADAKGLTALDHAEAERHEETAKFLRERGAIGATTMKDLLAAARTGDLPTVQRLLKLMPDRINLADENQNTLLMLAAQQKRDALVAFLLENKADLKPVNREGLDALHLAASRGNAPVVNLLLAAGADPKARGAHGQTAVMRAADARAPDAFRLLFNANRDLDARSDDGWTLLHFATRSNSLEIVPLLVAAGADVNARSVDGTTPLHLAAANANKELVALFIDRKANVNAKDAKAATPLHAAAQSAEAEIVAALLAAGADVNAVEQEHQNTALTHAAIVGRIDILRTLLEHGADLEMTCDHGTAYDIAVTLKHADALPLLMPLSREMSNAAAAGDVPTVRRLLAKRPALANGSAGESWTPLDRAARAGQVAVMEVLLAAKADVNSRGSTKQTPLFGAANEGRIEAVNLLLGAGAAIDAADEKGRTALIYILSSKHDDIMKLLIEKGTNVNAKDTDGDSALDLAVSFGKYELADLLRAKGATGQIGSHEIFQAAGAGDMARLQLLLKADPQLANLKSQRNWTPLGTAATSGRLEAVKLLLETGAEVNAADNYGNTALSAAAFHGQTEIVRLLLAKGANPKAARQDGQTPLHSANRASTELLVAAGAEVNARTLQGTTPLHEAAYRADYETVEFLVRHGAESNPRNSDGKTPLDYAAQGRGFLGKSLEDAKSIEAKKKIIHFLVVFHHGKQGKDMGPLPAKP
jgi:ankyrin repeat protein